MIEKNELIELISLLFQLNNDKNFELSDLEVYKYQKMLESIKKYVPNNFRSDFVRWEY